MIEELLIRSMQLTGCISNIFIEDGSVDDGPTKEKNDR